MELNVRQDETGGDLAELGGEGSVSGRGGKLDTCVVIDGSTENGVEGDLEEHRDGESLRELLRVLHVADKGGNEGVSDVGVYDVELRFEKGSADSRGGNQKRYVQRRPCPARRWCPREPRRSG